MTDPKTENDNRSESQASEPQPETAQPGSPAPSQPSVQPAVASAGASTGAIKTEPQTAGSVSDKPSAKKKWKERGKGCGLGCLKFVVVPFVVLVVFLFGYSEFLDWREAAAIRAKGEEAASAIMEASTPRYDIDETIRMMHDLDQLIEQNSTTYIAYLETSKSKTFDNIAPEVAEGRAELIRKMTLLYSQIEAEEEREAIFSEYRYSFEYFSSIVSLSNGLLPVSFDRDEASIQLERLWQESEQKTENLEKIRVLRFQYLDALEDYYAVYRTYHNIWDEFCRVRDDAYLHADDGEWERAMEALDQALELSPMDRESRLLKARVLIAQSQGTELPEQKLAEAEVILDELLEDTAELEAPVLMLKGIIDAERGNLDIAQDSFQLAATRFENQIERYNDSASLYDMRDYLKASPEGQRILRNFKAMMQGGGTYSPDLQRSKALSQFAIGPNEQVRETLLSHFRNRIGQEQRIQSELDDTIGFYIEQASTVEPPQPFFQFWNPARARANYNRELRQVLTPTGTEIFELRNVGVLENFVVDLEFVEQNLGNANQLDTSAMTLVCEYVPRDDSLIAPDATVPVSLDIPLVDSDIVETIQELAPSPGMIRVINDSTKKLTNVALVLQVRYTDMVSEEFIYLLFPRTVPSVDAGGERAFGQTDFAYVHSGLTKDVSDIVEIHGIIVADQGVGFVDGKTVATESTSPFESEIQESNDDTVTETGSVP